MKRRISKTSVILKEKEKSNKYLWAVSDEYNHTIFQLYSEVYPKHLEKMLKINAK